MSARVSKPPPKCNSAAIPGQVPPVGLTKGRLTCQELADVTERSIVEADIGMKIRAWGDVDEDERVGLSGLEPSLEPIADSLNGWGWSPSEDIESFALPVTLQVSPLKQRFEGHRCENSRPAGSGQVR